MIDLGTTVRCNEEPRHIWVVISDPAIHGGRILFVSLTTLKDNKLDDVCALNREDYPRYISHPTTVAYSRARVGDAVALQRAIDSGYFTRLERMPITTLKKIIDGARRSEHLAPSKKALLPDLSHP